MSSSSSEDEADNYVTVSPKKRKESEKKTSRYECPADFVTFCHKPCSSTLTESLKESKSELWLIKAPASFNPECFSGVTVPLSGFQTLKVPNATSEAKAGSNQQIYSILASTRCASELHLLTKKNNLSDGMVFGHAFSGLLNICESYGNSITNRTPHVIPAVPAPSIPPGLKQRFHPFGSSSCVAKNEAGGAAFGPSSTTLHTKVVKRMAEDITLDEEEEEGRKKKKKKKKKMKEKRIKTEEEELVEVVRMKEEHVGEIGDEVMMEVPLQEVDISEEKRKKKKKKKDRGREEVEEGVKVTTDYVTVKREPLDTSNGDVVEGSGKKKKKKKDREREEVEEEGVRMTMDYVTVKCEPLDTSYGDVVEGSGKKKKKKKKSKTEDD